MDDRPRDVRSRPVRVIRLAGQGAVTNAKYLFSVGPALRPGRVWHLVAAPRRWAPYGALVCSVVGFILVDDVGGLRVRDLVSQTVAFPNEGSAKLVLRLW